MPSFAITSVQVVTSATRAKRNVDGLPTYPGWRGIGAKIRDVIGAEKAADALRLSLYATLVQADGRLFPPLASAFQAIRLRQKAEAFAEELRRRSGVRPALPTAGAAAPQGSNAEFDDDTDEGAAEGAAGPSPSDDDDPPTFL